MSRRPRLAVVAFVGLMSAGVQPEASAQQTDADLTRLVDSLAPLLPDARRAAGEAGEQAERERRILAAPATDTISVGPLTIVTLPSQVALAEQIFTEAWQLYQPHVGATERLRSRWIAFQWRPRVQPIYMEGEYTAVEAGTWRPRSWVENKALDALGMTLREDVLGTRLRNEWMGDGVRPPADVERIYRTLITVPSKQSRECLAGDGLACWSVLGLSEAERPWEQWYTDDELRATVVRTLFRSFRFRRMARMEACVERADVEACASMIEEGVRRPTDLAPLGTAERQAALWVALERGGEGAFERLAEDPEATPAEALVHAAGMTPEQLGLAWRELVLSARPPVHAIPPHSRWMALFWIVFFSALAMRSSRWRLG